MNNELETASEWKLIWKRFIKHKLALFGLSFKPNTDDIRDSTSLKIAQHLFEQGIMINCYDPVSNDNARDLFPMFSYYQNAYEASEAVDAIIIGTEWNEFRALNFLKLKSLMKNLVIFDLRNIYNKQELLNLGFDYHGIGK